jgi:hypothetical protein
MVDKAEDRPDCLGSFALEALDRLARSPSRIRPARPSDLHAAIAQLKIRSSLTAQGNPYGHPDPRVREEMLATMAKQQHEADTDARVIGALTFACGLMGDDVGARKLLASISFVSRNNAWLNVRWVTEHACEMLSPLIDVAWREYAGMRFTAHSWPGKTR